MPAPWDADHGLDREDLERALAEAVLSAEHEGSVRLAARPAPRWVAQGWDCDVLALSDVDGIAWLVKVPRRAAVVGPLRREAALLEELERLAPSLAPRLGSRGRAGALPHDWIAVSVAPGASLFDRLDSVDPAPLGASVGARLRAVHEASPSVLGARPGRIAAERPSYLGDPVPALAALRLHVGPELTERVAARLERESSRAPGHVPARFVHGDVFPEHVFFDPATGGVTALIDWSDAGWGDPAIDFSPVAWLLGDAFLVPALEAWARAGGDADGVDAMRARAERQAFLVGIHDVDVAARGAPNVPLAPRIAALRARAAEGWLERA
jgi:macrolide phosphotransferase